MRKVAGVATAWTHRQICLFSWESLYLNLETENHIRVISPKKYIYKICESAFLEWFYKIQWRMLFRKVWANKPIPLKPRHETSPRAERNDDVTVVRRSAWLMNVPSFLIGWNFPRTILTCRPFSVMFVTADLGTFNINKPVSGGNRNKHQNRLLTTSSN